jgi:hypothetical protein
MGRTVVSARLATFVTDRQEIVPKAPRFLASNRCMAFCNDTMSFEKNILTILIISIGIISCGKTNNKGQVEINIDKILEIEDETAAIIELDTKLNEISEYGEKIERLTESQKTVLFVENLEREINNGGFNQFFFNSSGDFTHETVKALKVINAFKTSDIVTKSISVWPNQDVPKDRAKRQDILEQIEEGANPIWNECDEEFYKYQDNIVALLLDYVKSNKSDF